MYFHFPFGSFNFRSGSFDFFKYFRLVSGFCLGRVAFPPRFRGAWGFPPEQTEENIRAIYVIDRRLISSTAAIATAHGSDSIFFKV